MRNQPVNHSLSVVGFLLYLTGVVRSPILTYNHLMHETCIATSPFITIIVVRPFRTELYLWLKSGTSNTSTITVVIDSERFQYNIIFWSGSIP
ncbi:hypothetical protein PRIPAC_79172 [Pristionchus pacificus]|uniref:Uncharacterized protein n=1 Tax=Pristionchus pacificus TaxID=54126 RepID=A0A2A6C4S0_PRIPA|nr:hypothetical protein PRIPAC_79172 [Pristionchus pacificus]|eukprot:PDM73088.1 hypothetical protein PRIPAC_39522 [Pristionchus pacificus]